MRAVPDRAALPRRFERFIVGGAALDPRWAERCRRLGVGLDLGYGLTEAGPIVAVGAALAMPSGACGRPLPGIDVRIGERREILVRGPNVMPGYLGDPGRTARAMRDGWLATGDFGRLDRDGHLFVEGRLKDAVVPDTGETVWPEEIEEHYRSALLKDVAVGVRRGPHGNDVPVLRVVPAVADRAAVVRCVNRLRKAAPARCRVKEMEIMNRPLPRNAAGEIVRREGPPAREQELRALIEEATGEDLSPYSAETDLTAELVIDSLAALRVLALVEHRYDVRFPDDRLGDFRSLRGLMDAIEQRKESSSCVSA
jgi:long-subunit acyl-CoA synthetase (AMP-forming)